MDKTKKPSSGFTHEPIGSTYPADTKIKKNKDGTITLLSPKSKKSK